MPQRQPNKEGQYDKGTDTVWATTFTPAGQTAAGWRFAIHRHNTEHNTQPLPITEQQPVGSFIDKHQQLSTRAGVVLNESEIFADLSLAQRSARRIQMRQEQQQLNLERVMALALDYCTETVTAQDVDPDWFQAYCELVLDISTHSMQKLWAKILAGEISNPGNFSLKTFALTQANELQRRRSLAACIKPELSDSESGTRPYLFWLCAARFDYGVGWLGKTAAC